MFLVNYTLIEYPLKSILIIKNPILKKTVYEFSIKDFVKGCPLQILDELYEAQKRPWAFRG